MPGITDVLVGAVVLGLLGLGTWKVAKAYREFRGKRVIVCPATGHPAAVELAAWHIAWMAIFAKPSLRLSDCSRWRGPGPCNQDCLRDIAAAPEECLVGTILAKWYEGKTCACCGAELEKYAGWRHKPCVMSPDLQMREWTEIPAEDIPRVLTTHAPVCWTCLVAETRTS